MRSAFIRALVVCLITVTPLQVSIADPASDAEALIRKGVELRRQEKDFEAFPLFQQAHQLKPTARAAAQLGLVEQALGRWVDAEVHLLEAMAAENDPWIKKNKSVLDQSLATVRGHVGQIEVRGEPEGAEVFVNGKPRGTLPLAGPLRAAEGYVEVELRKPGFKTAGRTVTLQPRQFQQLFVRLEREHGPVAASAPVGPQAPVASPRSSLPATNSVRTSGGGQSHPGTRLRLAALGTSALGVGALVFGGVMTLKVRDYEKQSRQADLSEQRYRDIVADGDRAERWQWIGYGVAAAALMGGAVLWWAADRADAQGSRTAVTPLFGNGFAGLSASARF